MKYFKQISCTFFLVFLFLSSFAQTPDSTTFNSHFAYPISDSTHFTSQISSPPFSSVHYRGDATVIIDDKPQECQFSIVNVIDSFLYVQLNLGPLEVGRVLITPNNIVFINKLQKNYYDGDYSFIEKMLGAELDFYTVQGIFNGSLIEDPEEFDLTYQRDSISYEYPFFKTLLCEYYTLSIELNVKKVTFNAPLNVSATIPKNYKEIKR
jgi:hypothetical protein